MMELDLSFRVDVMKIDEKVQYYLEVVMHTLFVGLIL